MGEQELQVLYIVGWGRSGSTVLGNILGEPGEAFSTGELHYLWERGLLQHRRCGCGAPTADCPVWSMVWDDLHDETGSTPEEVVRCQDEQVRVRHTFRLVRHDPGQPTGNPELDRYIEVLGATYRAIARHTGARVIVDSSKRPSDAAVLRLVPGVRSSFVHLVRDPRAVAFSWQRKKAQNDPAAGRRFLLRHGPAASTRHWLVWNLAAEALGSRIPADRWFRLRYEDFMASPREAVQRVLGLLEEPPAASAFVDERSVRLSRNHTVSGNPDRFTEGVIPLRLDDEWRAAQPGRDQRLAAAIAAPLMARYGYPLRLR